MFGKIFAEWKRLTSFCVLCTQNQIKKVQDRKISDTRECRGFSCVALFAGVWFYFSLLSAVFSLLFDSYVLLADDHVNNVSYFPFMSIKKVVFLCIAWRLLCNNIKRRWRCWITLTGWSRTIFFLFFYCYHIMHIIIACALNFLMSYGITEEMNLHRYLFNWHGLWDILIIEIYSP
jgi:glucan phosphoethanolaminetransferase (alkaline phosphatase superfamily)